MQNDEMTFKASVFTVFLCIIFGANAVAIKISLAGFGAFTVAGIRFAIAAIVILLWAWIKKIELKISSKQLLQMLILTIIFVLQLAAFYIGLGKTTASHATLIANVLPFCVLIMAHFFIPGDTITIKKGIGITLGFIGVLFLFFDQQELNGLNGTSSDLKQGDFIILFAVLAWSSSVIFVKRIIDQYNAIQITVYPMIFGIPFFILGGILWDDQMIITINAAVVTALLYQALISAAFGFIAWNNLLLRFGATALHSFVFIMPLAGVLLGVLLLGDAVTPHLIVSISCIVLGVIIVNMRRKRRFKV